MTGVHWEEVKDGDNTGGYVGFRPSCHAPEHARCHGHPRHGHVCIVNNEGLTATIPFPVLSQEGVRKIIGYEVEQGSLSNEELAAVMRLSAVGALPHDLQASEKAILDDPEQLKRFTTYGYAGFM